MKREMPVQPVQKGAPILSKREQDRELIREILDRRHDMLVILS